MTDDSESHIAPAASFGRSSKGRRHFIPSTFSRPPPGPPRSRLRRGSPSGGSRPRNRNPAQPVARRARAAGFRRIRSTSGRSRHIGSCCRDDRSSHLEIKRLPRLCKNPPASCEPGITRGIFRPADQEPWHESDWAAMPQASNPEALPAKDRMADVHGLSRIWPSSSSFARSLS